MSVSNYEKRLHGLLVPEQPPMHCMVF